MRNYSKDEPLLMIPGPVESHDKVLQSMAERTLSHTEDRFVSAFQNSLTNLRQVFSAGKDYSPLVVAGGGTLAMEISLVNLIDKSKDQQALICDSGYFGDRFTIIADHFDLSYDVIPSESGHKLSEDSLNEYLSNINTDFAFIQHVDTSTGVANDIEMFGKLCSDHNVISVVDGVCALGGQDLYQEDWGIDIYLTGAQKALALPPGLAIMMYSPKAREISETRENPINSYYSNLDNWWPIMDAYLSNNVSYYSTPPTNQILGLEQTTKLLLEEGMQSVYERHRRLASKFRVGMKDMGFEFITAEDSFANTLSTPKYLDASKSAEFHKAVLEEGVLIAGGIQSGLADQYFRVGHMGTVTDEHIHITLDAINKAI